MTTSVQVLQYIKSEMPRVTSTQAMKLLYYTQAWSLVWTGRQAFSDPVIAWQYGPATLDAYQAFQNQVQPRRDLIGADLKSVVDAVIVHYGQMTAGQLRDMTHSERPWRNVYYAADGGHEARRAISLTDMKKEYTMQALKGKGPTKPQLHSAVVNQAAFEALLDRVRAEDREALDILASR